MKAIALLFLALSINAYAATNMICPQRDQKVLVLDLKSGWWQPFFLEELKRKVQESCKNIDIEYHHLILGGPARRMCVVTDLSGRIPQSTEFPLLPWNEYQQIWILGGDPKWDSVDFQPGDPDLEKILKGVKTTSASLFLGGAWGHNDHTNAVLQAIGLRPVFLTTLPDPAFPPDTMFTPFGGGNPPTPPTPPTPPSPPTPPTPPSPGDIHVQVNTRLTKGKELLPHPLFVAEAMKLTEEIQCYSEEGQFPMVSDYLGEGIPVPVVALNSNGKPIIAAGHVSDRKMVLDAGHHRLFAIIEASEVGTFQYLMALFKYLEH